MSFKSFSNNNNKKKTIQTQGYREGKGLEGREQKLWALAFSV